MSDLGDDPRDVLAVAGTGCAAVLVGCAFPILVIGGAIVAVLALAKWVLW